MDFLAYQKERRKADELSEEEKKPANKKSRVF